MTYTLHFPARKKFKRNKILVCNIDQQWEADLVDLREHSKHLQLYFSKYAFAAPLKNKIGNELVEALKTIFFENFVVSSMVTLCRFDRII